MQELDSTMATRSKALQTALKLPLPDAVYEVVRYNDWAFAFDEIYRIDLAELESKGSSAELQEWQQRSLKLRRDAYAVGDAGLRDDRSYDQARARFVSANPGFGDVSYQSAILFGYRQAR